MLQIFTFIFPSLTRHSKFNRLFILLVWKKDPLFYVEIMILGIDKCFDYD